MAYHDIEVTHSGAVCEIAFNRPAARNAIRVHETVDDMLAALDAADADPAIRAIVVTGRGTAFCAGGDVKEMVREFGGGEVDPADARRYVQRFHRMCLRLYDIEKPVIAAVNGAAVGAGCALALLADLRIASDQATFCFAFVHRGLVSDSGSTYTLPRLVGDAKAYELLTLGDTIGAEDALRIGLVSKVVAHANLETETLALANRFAAGPPKALAMMKRSLRLGAEGNLAATLEHEAMLQAMTFTGAEHKEGAAAFLEKRKPVF